MIDRDNALDVGALHIVVSPVVGEEGKEYSKIWARIETPSSEPEKRDRDEKIIGGLDGWKAGISDEYTILLEGTEPIDQYQIKVNENRDRLPLEVRWNTQESHLKTPTLTISGYEKKVGRTKPTTTMLCEFNGRDWFTNKYQISCEKKQVLDPHLFRNRSDPTGI